MIPHGKYYISCKGQTPVGLLELTHTLIHADVNTVIVVAYGMKS